MARLAFQTAMRAASVAFLEAYKTAASLKLQVYPARPRSISPPTAFVDNISEVITYTALNQRVVQVDVIVVHGLLDSLEAATQRDAFVDGLIDYALDNVHQADPNTTIAVVSTADEPAYVPEWLEPQYQRTYYATTLTLEGLDLTG